MPRAKEVGRYDKPAPEPHFIPGYAGHCPDLADHIGETYSWATYVILKDKPEIAGRLSPIKAPVNKRGKFGVYGSKDTDAADADEKISKERQSAQKHPRLREDASVGYGGHVPKVQEGIGKTQQHVFRKAIADFERQQRKERSGADESRKCCCCNCSCCSCCHCQQ